jgi:hypothetical protein
MVELISALFYPTASGSGMFDDSIPWTMPKAPRLLNFTPAA